MNADILVEADEWSALDLEPLVQGAINALTAHAPAGLRGGDVALLFTSDEAVRHLNRDFRGKDKPTNVLSFPADTEGLPEGMDAPLGDIALAWGVTSREAAERQISAAAHTTHLVVHGLLHLLGYDHIDDDEAEEMEAIERAVLARLQIADPYRLSGGLDGAREPMEMTMADGEGPSTVAPTDPAAPLTTHQSRGLRGLLNRLTGPRTVGLTDVLQNGHGSTGALSDAERTMLERIVSFDKKRVDDVAIPRADIVGIGVDAELKDVLAIFSEANHSRMPVYRGDLDDPIGMVHIKDIVGVIADPAAAGAANDERPFLDQIKRKILYVPPSMPVTDLLLRMQASRVHMALVIDEYGGTDGLVTIEDLIELIVGDIRDEHDEAVDFSLRSVAEDRWESDARVPLEDFARETGVDLRLDDHDADTVGGLVLSLCGRIPLRGEVIAHPAGHEVDIVDADPRTVRRVQIRLGALPAQPAETSSDDLVK